jgi:hypothetical protein
MISNARHAMAFVLLAVLAGCPRGPVKPDGEKPTSVPTATTKPSPEPGPSSGKPGGASAGGLACGPNICGAGEFCCNSSCGICAPEGGFCTQQICEPGPGGDPTPVPAPPGAATGGSCKADADCRLFDDYCTGCDCRALSIGDKEPTCAGPGVRCIAQPCRGKTAYCNKGTCAVR